MILRLEIELRQIAVPADLDRVLVGEPVGSARVRQVGRGRQEQGERGFGFGELRLEFLQLGAHLGDLADQRSLLIAGGPADRLRCAILLRSELLDAPGQLAASFVRRQQLIDALRQTPPGERRAERLRVFPDQLDVEHPVTPSLGWASSPPPPSAPHRRRTFAKPPAPE